MDRELVRRLIDSGTSDRHLLSLAYRVMRGDTRFTAEEIAALAEAVLALHPHVARLAPTGGHTVRSTLILLATLIALPALLTAQDSTADGKLPQLLRVMDSVEARYVAHRASPYATTAELIAEDDTLATQVAATLNALSVLGGGSVPKARLSGPHLAKAVGDLVFILRRTMEDRNARTDRLIASCSGRR